MVLINQWTFELFDDNAVCLAAKKVKYLLTYLYRNFASIILYTKLRAEHILVNAI